MTEYRATAVNSYKFTSEDQLFLDANIWLYVYGPQKPDDKQAAIYSQVLRHILDARSCIYIDVLVISEFINTYARRKWKLDRPKIKQFKNFRSSTDFKPAALEIADNVRRVMSHCARIEDGFVEMEVDNLLSTYATGVSDFNDQVITELCKRAGLTLITHDGDFKGQGVPILTANQRLLN